MIQIGIILNPLNMPRPLPGSKQLVEATTISSSRAKPLSFAQTVEAIRTSDFSGLRDYRALKALGELRAQTVLRNQTEVEWFDSLSARADDSAVEKIQQRFSCPTDSMTV